jgi:hypothetical protein
MGCRLRCAGAEICDALPAIRTWHGVPVHNGLFDPWQAVDADPIYRPIALKGDHRTCRGRSTLSRYSVVVAVYPSVMFVSPFALAQVPHSSASTSIGGAFWDGRGVSRLRTRTDFLYSKNSSALMRLACPIRLANRGGGGLATVHAATSFSPSAWGVTFAVLIRHRSTASCLASATAAFLRIAREPDSSTGFQRLSRQ